MSLKKIFKQVLKTKKEGTLPALEQLGFVKHENKFGTLYLKHWPISEIDNTK